MEFIGNSDDGIPNPNSDPKFCHLVAVPYPGRGHVNPMMNLCNQLSSTSKSKGLLLITIVVTEEWLGLIAASSSSSSFANNNIRFCTIPNVIPSEHVRGADFPAFVEAVYTKMELPFERLLDRLHPPASCIIADAYMPWAVAVGNRRSIPVASLWAMSPSIFSLFYHFHHFFSIDDDFSERGTEAIDFIPGIKSMRLEDLRPFCLNKGLLSRALEASCWASKAQCLVLTSFYELESHVTDALRALLPFPVYTLGPSIPYMSLLHDDYIKGGSSAHYNCWLDSQPQNSLLYVSMGSFLSVSEAQMDEIATGLRDSGVRFLWVVRGNGNASRMQEFSGEMGLVVPWCDQLRVLCHSSVGGFLTHCGLNSTLESIYAGVPMLTFPIAWDQFHDSKLIVDDLEVGLSLKAKSSMLGVEPPVVRGEEIALIVQRLMDLDRDESKELRRRAKQLQETCQRSLDKGGSSYTNLEAFVSEFVCRPH